MEETQNQTQGNQPKSDFGKWISIAMLTICLIGSNILSWTIITSQGERIESQSADILQRQTDEGRCLYKKDSLMAEVRSLSKYKSLTKAMIHRDQATSLLQYQVGDIVRSKRDSSLVVISDIVIGGSKYSYYVKYRILKADNSSEDVIPELIY